MYSYIVTIARVTSDAVEFVENRAGLNNSQFPVLRDAKVGEKYKLFTDTPSNNYGIGFPIKKVEKVQT